MLNQIISSVLRVTIPVRDCGSFRVLQRLETIRLSPLRLRAWRPVHRTHGLRTVIRATHGINI